MPYPPQGALFQTGFKPYFFREMGDLAEIGLEYETLPEYIFLRTNVAGAIETLDQSPLFAAIDATLDGITSGWQWTGKKGHEVLSHRIALASDFPFMDQFAEAYAQACGMGELVRCVTAAKGGLSHCRGIEVERYCAYIEEGYPVNVAVEFSGELANRFIADMEVTPEIPVHTRRRG